MALTAQLTGFTKSWSDAVDADTELSVWLTSKNKVLQLSPGLPAKPYLRRTVQVDPTVGESFLGVWSA